MQISITLSKKEKRHYFLYLLGMLVLAVFILSTIILSKAANPFSEADKHSVMILQDKTKFNEAQQSVHKLMDSAFTKINKMDPEKTSPVENNSIEVKISEISRSFEGAQSNDPRKTAYPLIAKFYAMYYQDKKSISTSKENTQQLERQLNECVQRLKSKQDQIMQP